VTDEASYFEVVRSMSDDPVLLAAVDKAEVERGKRNCGTCQHWERFAEGEGECHRITRVSDVVMLIDAGEYTWLSTPPSFSCSLWEAKP